MIDPIPFALPAIGRDEIDEVVATLESGWLTTGPRTARFEEEFRRYLNTDSAAVAVNSATAGLHLSLEAAGIGAGDEVIVPTYTFTATAEVVRYLDAMPVFADVDPHTLNLDIDHLRHLIGERPRVRAVMPVHFAGLPCDMSAIREVARSAGIAVVEDAAHALPAAHGTEVVGSRSEYAVFSFYATKGITTAEGGMVVVSDAERAGALRTMAFHGIDRIAFDRYRSAMPAWHYDVVAPGYKYNMSDVAAAIGLKQLAKADAFHTRRTEIAQQYLSAFADLPLQLPAVGATGDVHSWHLFVVRLMPERAGLDRDGFVGELARAGIGTSVHFIPLHVLSYWSELTGLQPESLPVAVSAYENAVSLPIYPSLTDDQVTRVIETVRSVVSPDR